MNMNFLFPLAESMFILLWIKQQNLVYYFTLHKSQMRLQVDRTDGGTWQSMFR